MCQASKKWKKCHTSSTCAVDSAIDKPSQKAQKNKIKSVTRAVSTVCTLQLHSNSSTASILSLVHKLALVANTERLTVLLALMSFIS